MDNIYAINGAKVKCVRFNAGHDWQKEEAKENLTIGKEYTVRYIDLKDFSSTITLEEIPGMYFNTVFFENVGDCEVCDSDDCNVCIVNNPIPKINEFSCKACGTIQHITTTHYEFIKTTPLGTKECPSPYETRKDYLCNDCGTWIYDSHIESN